jgi:hypothetical protein
MAIVQSEEAVKEYQQARFIAQQKSYDGCVYHVNVHVTMHPKQNAMHVSFFVSEWYSSGQTVASFSNGSDHQL